MTEYIFLMHNDATDYPDENAWEPYLGKLKQGGFLQGASVIGDGVCARKSGAPAPITEELTGYVMVRADSLDQAKSLLMGNPGFEAGGTVEIRELLAD